MQTTTQEKLSIFNVRSIEDEWELIQEAEKNYKQNWWISIQDAYKQWLEFINNL